MSITIRDATVADGAIIADFNCRMARETEARELDRAVIDAGVAALLADASRGRYWVAEIDDEVVGQLMVTLEWSDWRNGMLWWIQSVYVARQFRRSGVFSALYKHVESLAYSDPQVCGMRLYVEQDNRTARATYQGLGMTETGYQVMEIVF